MACRICYEPNNLISVCGCSGTMEFVHQQCVDRWRAIKKSKHCELCKQPYRTPFTLSCAGVIYLSIGVLLTFVHAFITNYSTKNYPGDISNSLCGSFLMCWVYSTIFCILRFFEYIYTKIAYIVWPLCFFSLSILLQYGEMESIRVELLTNYTLFVVYFIGWRVFEYFFELF